MNAQPETTKGPFVPADHLGELVDAYWNLHRKCYSVRSPKTRRVLGHSHRLVLGDVTFRVSEAGRQRVLREGRKNVHAFVRGTVLDDWPERHPISGRRALTYNPYDGPDFTLRLCPDRPPIRQAAAVEMWAPRPLPGPPTLLAAEPRF